MKSCSIQSKTKSNNQGDFALNIIHFLCIIFPCWYHWVVHELLWATYMSGTQLGGPLSQTDGDVVSQCPAPWLGPLWPQRPFMSTPPPPRFIKSQSKPKLKNHREVDITVSGGGFMWCEAGFKDLSYSENRSHVSVRCQAQTSCTVRVSFPQSS